MSGSGPSPAVKSFVVTLGGIALVVFVTVWGFNRWVTGPRSDHLDEQQDQLLVVAEDLCDTAEGLRVVVLAFVPSDTDSLTPTQQEAYERLGQVECDGVANDPDVEPG